VRRRLAGQPPRDPPYAWLSATAQPGAVPGAWLKVADWVVFQSPVHPGGGTSELDGAATTAAGAAATATAAGSARASTAAPAATGMRTVRCMVSLLCSSGNAARGADAVRRPERSATAPSYAARRVRPSHPHPASPGQTRYPARDARPGPGKRRRAPARGTGMHPVTTCVTGWQHGLPVDSAPQATFCLGSNDSMSERSGTASRRTKRRLAERRWPDRAAGDGDRDRGAGDRQALFGPAGRAGAPGNADSNTAAHVKALDIAWRRCRRTRTGQSRSRA